MTQYHSNVKIKSVANLTVRIEFTSGNNLLIPLKAEIASISAIIHRTILYLSP